MSSIISHTPWQCSLYNSKSRDNALYLNERLSDLTVTFPFHNISFPAHRLIMAKTSPYFENLFYGPMAMHGQEWKVKDNEVDPEVFKVVLAHCYEVNLLNESWEMILEVYKLADCYMIDSLKSECLESLEEAMLNDNDIDLRLIIEWSTKYGFYDIEYKIFEFLSNKSNHAEICSYGLPIDCEIYKKISNLLLNLPLEKQKDLLGRCEHSDILIFDESWQHPENILSDKVLISIFENSMCKNTCKTEYFYLKGCISAKVVLHFINMKRITSLLWDMQVSLNIYVSLTNVSHSQTLYECLKVLYDEDQADIIVHPSLHIPCNSLSPEHTVIWGRTYVDEIYLSKVDDESIPWAVATIMSLKCPYIYFPRSTLSFNGFKALLRNLDTLGQKNLTIDICSSNMKMEYMQELNTMSKYEIEIHEFDEGLCRWYA